MINHFKPQRHGPSTTRDMSVQHNGLIRIMVVVTGFVFLQVIPPERTGNTIQSLPIRFDRGTLSRRTRTESRSYFCLFTPSKGENAHYYGLANPF